MSKPTTTVRIPSPKPRRCCARRRRELEGDPSCSAAASGWAGWRRCRRWAARPRRRIGAAPAIPAASSWTADPDDQFLLDVRIRQLRLGDGVRAYATPEGTCIVFGDFINTLDVPMKIDLAAKKASGWAFKEGNRIAIDLAAGSATYRRQERADRAGTVRETPEGWCVQTAALARWFGIGVKPMTSGSVVILESEAKLPVELAVERQLRAAQLKPAKFDLSTLPQVRLPYRMWRAPALDFVVSGGVTYRAHDGVKVDRHTSVYAAGEIAHLSYDAQLSTTQKGMPDQLAAARLSLGPRRRAARAAEGDPFRLRRRRRARQPADRNRRPAAAARSSPTGRCSPSRRSTAPASKAICRAAGTPKSIATASCLAFAKPTADQRYHFEDFSFSTARTA